jgi:hypothetical protein
MPRESSTPPPPATPIQSHLRSDLANYMVENWQDEDWQEVVSPVRAAYEAGWLDGRASALLEARESKAREG